LPSALLENGVFNAEDAEGDGEPQRNCFSHAEGAEDAENCRERKEPSPAPNQSAKADFVSL
jgi:hypothetical protein